MSSEELPDWSDELDDSEYPDEDHEDDDSDAVVPCPQCGADIYEDADRCPYCGNYVTHDTSAWTGRSWWWILLGLLGTAAVIVSMAGC